MCSYSGCPLSLHATLAAAMFQIFQQTNISSPALGMKTFTAPVSGYTKVLNFGLCSDVTEWHKEMNITFT